MVNKVKNMLQGLGNFRNLNNDDENKVLSWECSQKDGSRNQAMKCRSLEI
jgi:hypothetical protein